MAADSVERDFVFIQQAYEKLPGHSEKIGSGLGSKRIVLWNQYDSSFFRHQPYDSHQMLKKMRRQLRTIALFVNECDMPGRKSGYS